jgi:hypothetical protein
MKKGDERYRRREHFALRGPNSNAIESKNQFIVRPAQHGINISGHLSGMSIEDSLIIRGDFSARVNLILN